MILSQAQLMTLKADILADPILAGWAATGRMAQEIADAYNVIVSPAWLVWRTDVTSDEMYSAIFETNGGLQLDALTANKRESLFKLIDRNLNASIPASRANIDDYCGSQINLKAALQAVEKRPATRGEKLFSSGLGSLASPATMTAEGLMISLNIDEALAQP